eukprot:gene14472-20493_t
MNSDRWMHNKADIHGGLNELTQMDIAGWFAPDSPVSRVLIIRDPIDRFVSGYLDKIVTKKRQEVWPEGVLPAELNASIQSIELYLDHYQKKRQEVWPEGVLPAELNASIQSIELYLDHYQKKRQEVWPDGVLPAELNASIQSIELYLDHYQERRQEVWPEGVLPDQLNASSQSIELYLDHYQERRQEVWPEGVLPDELNASSQSIELYLDHYQVWMRNDHFGVQSNWCGIRTHGVRIWDTLIVYNRTNMANIVSELSKQIDLEPYLHNWGPNRDSDLFSSFTAIFSSLCKRHLKNRRLWNGHLTTAAPVSATITSTASVDAHLNQALPLTPPSPAPLHASVRGKTLVTQNICNRLVNLFQEDYANFFPMISLPNCSSYPTS